MWSNGTLWADATEPGFAYWEKETGDICTIADTSLGWDMQVVLGLGCWLWDDWYIRSCSCQCMVWSCWHSSRHLPVVAIHQSAQSRKTGLTCTRSKTWKGCIFYGASALMGLSHQTAEPCCYWPVEWGLRLHGYTSQRTSPHLTESYKERKQNESLQNEVQKVFLLTVWNMVDDPNN